MLKVKQLVSDKWNLIQDKITSLRIANFLIIIVYCLQIGKATSPGGHLFLWRKALTAGSLSKMGCWNKGVKIHSFRYDYPLKLIQSPETCPFIVSPTIRERLLLLSKQLHLLTTAPHILVFTVQMFLLPQIDFCAIHTCRKSILVSSHTINIFNTFA